MRLVVLTWTVWSKTRGGDENDTGHGPYRGVEQWTGRGRIGSTEEGALREGLG